MEISSEECLRPLFLGYIAYQEIADRHEVGRMMPDGGAGDDLEQTVALPYHPVTRRQRVRLLIHRSVKVG
jgi:hypothetical protein